MSGESAIAPCDQPAEYAPALGPSAVAVHGDSNFAMACTNLAESQQGDEVYLRRFDRDRSLAMGNDFLSESTEHLGDQDRVEGEFRVNTASIGAQFGASVADAPRRDSATVLNGAANQVAPRPDRPPHRDLDGDYFRPVDVLTPKGEIEVRGNGVIIADGDHEPATEDGTMLGEAVVGEAAVNHTFVIHNVGLGRLWMVGEPPIYVDGGDHADFSVAYRPAAFIEPRGTLEVTVSFAPSAAGLRRTTLFIVTDDADESPYEFALEGIGLAPQAPWQNPRDPFDVNGDGVVSGLDALVLINLLNSQGPHGLNPPENGGEPPPYVDVNGDNQLSPLDVLQTINVLNSRRPPLAGSMVAQAPAGAFPPVSPTQVRPAESRQLADASVRGQEADAVFARWTEIAEDRTEKRSARRIWG